MGKNGRLAYGGKKKSELHWYLLLFAVSFVGMLAAFVPTMIRNNGIFLYYGDFNSQQMMFYHHANEMVRNGNFGWDWGTDLGSNFIGSYSFYLLGSPFFWLSTLFPMDMVKYLMPWLLSLKTAVAAVTAYAYIRRFSKSPEACFVGGMLYAFSGFQVYNVFFNHFHDVTAFFPLLLLSFEQLTQDKRRGVFAVCVGLSAAISYFFFVGEVVFVVIYFFVRCFDKSFRIDMKALMSIIFEAVLGVMLAGVILFPAVYDVLLNPRLDSRLYGNDWFFYGENVRIARIIQAFFMMSDMPARVNILKSDSGRWASIAGYLPMFAMTGVVAYIRERFKKKDWLVRMVIVSGIMMCVPILNASYVAFNSSYYARWFYMPILLMCVMTAKVMEKDGTKLKLGYGISTIVGLAFVMLGMVPKKIDGVVTYGKNYQYEDLYKLQFIVTVVLAAVMGIIVYSLPKHKRFRQITAGVTAGACIIVMFAGVNFGAVQDGGHDQYIEHAINGRQNLDIAKLESYTPSNRLHEANTFYRIDTSENVDNWCMFWGLSSMRAFHSVVPPSIMDYYISIGQTRDVASRMETNLYAMRGLNSVRYYFKRCGDKKEEHTDTVSGLYGFEYIDTQNDFNIYENKYWIPMGFTYDKYTTAKVIDDTEKDLRPNIMLEAVVLSDDQIRRHSDILTEYNTDDEDTSEEHYYELCNEKRSESCYSFTYDTHGFDARIVLDREKLVYFSVPFCAGWTAEVNGVPTDIEQVNYGMMAVRCPAGDVSIHFSYETAWLKVGKTATAAGAVILVVYLVAAYFIFDKKERAAKAAAAETAEKPADGIAAEDKDDTDGTDNGSPEAAPVMEPAGETAPEAVDDDDIVSEDEEKGTEEKESSEEDDLSDGDDL